MTSGRRLNIMHAQKLISVSFFLEGFHTLCGNTAPGFKINIETGKPVGKAFWVFTVFYFSAMFVVLQLTV